MPTEEEVTAGDEQVVAVGIGGAVFVIDSQLERVLQDCSVRSILRDSRGDPARFR